VFEDDVALIKTVYEAFNRGDLDAVEAGFAPDAVQEAAVLGQTHTGRAQIRRSFEEYFDVVEAPHTEPVEFIEQSGLIVVPVRLHGRLRHTGITDDMLPTEMVHVFSVREGQIDWNYICAGLEEAMEAARTRG
jgi:ketosteroid isomerase-like protein